MVSGVGNGDRLCAKLRAGMCNLGTGCVGAAVKAENLMA